MRLLGINLYTNLAKITVFTLSVNLYHTELYTDLHLTHSFILSMSLTHPGPSGGAIQTHHRNQITPSYYFSHYYPSNSSNPYHQRNSSTLGSSPSSPHYHWAGPVINGGGARTPTDGTERPSLPRSASENRLRPSASGSSLFSTGSSPSTDTVLQRPGSAGMTEKDFYMSSALHFSC